LREWIIDSSSSPCVCVLCRPIHEVDVVAVLHRCQALRGLLAQGDPLEVAEVAEIRSSREELHGAVDQLDQLPGAGVVVGVAPSAPGPRLRRLAPRLRWVVPLSANSPKAAALVDGDERVGDPRP